MKKSIKNTNSIAERIYTARTQRKMSKRAVADQLGVSHPTVFYWEKGAQLPTKENLINLARALDVSEEWLISGYEKDSHERVENLQGIAIMQLPLLTIDEVSSWLESTAVKNKENVMQEDQEFGSRSFRLKVEGSALVDLAHPHTSVFPGEIVVLDPDKKPCSGNFVLAQIGNNPKNLKFRQYQEDGHDFFLKSFSEDYDTLTANDNVIIKGVVTNKLVKLA